MLKNLVLLILSTSLALVAAEVALRVVDARASTGNTINFLRDTPDFMPDPELTLVPRPGVRAVHARDGTFSSTFTTNAFGLRDRETTLEKPAGTTRIATLGDSFAWGFGVDDNAIFPALLEESMPGVEVINLGVTAYGLHEEILYFRRLGMRFDPDIVLVALVQNDIISGHLQPVPAGDTGAAQTTGNVSRFIALKRRLAANSRLYALLMDAVNGNRAIVELLVRLGIKGELGGVDQLDDNLRPALREPPPEVVEAWERTFERVRVLRGLTDSLGVRLVLALVPALQAVEPEQLERSLVRSRFWVDDFDMFAPYRRLEAFAAAERIEWINPVEAFRLAFQHGERRYLNRDIHFNERGHEAFAEAIRVYFERTGVGRSPAR
ncbi:MAG: hypothetical protein L0271_09380 [Gemmatimonadetes bacterium]|nr:hypothetical protein [Gemmatimonadota bacterium]